MKTFLQGFSEKEKIFRVLRVFGVYFVVIPAVFPWCAYAFDLFSPVLSFMMDQKTFDIVHNILWTLLPILGVAVFAIEDGLEDFKKRRFSIRDWIILIVPSMGFQMFLSLFNISSTDNFFASTEGSETWVFFGIYEKYGIIYPDMIMFPVFAVCMVLAYIIGKKIYFHYYPDMEATLSRIEQENIENKKREAAAKRHWRDSVNHKE